MGCGSSNSSDVKNSIDTTNPMILLKENTGEFKNDYSLKEQLGEGTYGIVRKCKHRKSGEERVVKKIHKKSLRKEELQKKLANDIIFLRKIDHPNVVKAYEFYQDETFFWVVTEIIHGGDLISKLEVQGYLTEKQASNIIKQVLSVLVWCHKRNIMHRDLKPENIMVDSQSKEDGFQVKVIDWGTAIQFNPKSGVNDLVGTPYYIAPEVVDRSKNYNEKCDIWSLGALLYTVLSGDPPFYADDIPQILHLVQEGNWSFEGDIWDQNKGGISNEAKDLIKKMMTKDPSSRISAEDALKHPWVQNTSNNVNVSDEQKLKYVQKMQKFNAVNKFQQATMLFISQQLSFKAERDELSKAFRSIDKNNDGTLSRDEILAYYKQTLDKEHAEKECQQMFDKIDVDQNGLINYSEFLMATYEFQNDQLKTALDEAFNYFDQDKNGYITTQELQTMIGENMKNSNQKLWDDIIKQNDTDKDGKINKEEFQKMMDQMAQASGQDTQR